MFGIGVPELVVILIIGLVLFGPGKLPELGRALGKSISELKKATADITDMLQQTPPTVNKSTVSTAAAAKDEQTTEVKPEESKITDK